MTTPTPPAQDGEREAFEPKTKLGRLLWEAAKKCRADPDTRLLSADEISFEIAGLLSEYDEMQTTIATQSAELAALRAQVEGVRSALIEISVLPYTGPDHAGEYRGKYPRQRTALIALAPPQPVAKETKP